MCKLSEMIRWEELMQNIVMKEKSGKQYNKEEKKA